jgi:hypothetical protein
VLDGSQWDEVSTRKEFSKAEKEFDAAVDAFFKPLTEAAEKVAKGIKRPGSDDKDSYVVLEEPEEGKPAKPGHLIKLNRDSIVLRLIESGNTDRLIWVNNQLEVTEAPVPQSASPAPAAEDVTPVNGDGDSTV